MMKNIVLHPLPGAGRLTRIKSFVRGLLSRRLLLRLAGTRYVVLEGRVYPVRAMPLGVARELIPTMMRCARKFVGQDIGEDLYDDLVKTLALGLGASVRDVENFTIPIWHFAPVIDAIAEANGIPVREVGAMGKHQAQPIPPTSTGTNSTPPSSAPPAGHGITSIRM